MRRKTYSMYGKAIDENGNEHIVTVVGEFEQFKEKVTVTSEAELDVEYRGVKKGVITYDDTVKVRKLSFGYAICNNEDEFDEDYGIKLAKRRAIKSPFGELSSVQPTMLTIDMCKLLVFGELSHIINNIDNYIK